MLQGDDEQLPLAEQTNQLLTDKHFALAEQLQGHYDLIVFPESALDTDPEVDTNLRQRITELAAEHDAYVLVNARTAGDDGDSRNTNRMYTPSGRLQGRTRSSTSCRSASTCRCATCSASSASSARCPTTSSPATPARMFHVAGRPVGSVICFESAFGPLVRDYVHDGAEMIVVSTNNRSYQRSANSEQHLALGQMRAAETGRPVLQASVSGISAVIDPDGSVHDRTELFESAIVTASVPTTTGETLYVRFGDWVVLLSAIALVVVTVIAIRRPVTPAVTRQELDRRHQADHHDDRPQRGLGEASPDVRAELRAEHRADRDRAPPPPRPRRRRTRRGSRRRRWRSARARSSPPLSRCRVVGDEDAEQAEQDHALGRPEVAAVDPGEEHADPQLEPAVLDDPAAPLGDQATEPGLEDHERRRPSGSGSGTTSSNTELGRVRRRTPPVMPPVSDAEPRIIVRRRWPPSSRRYPTAPLMLPKVIPTVLLTLATTGE